MEHAKRRIVAAQVKNIHLHRAVIVTATKEAGHGMPSHADYRLERIALLRFFAPVTGGRQAWQFFGENVCGEELFTLYFLYTGPILLLQSEGLVREYSPLALARMGSDVEEILCSYKP